MSETLSQLVDSQTTIVAISTPAGVGGIAVARLSGADALAIADRVWKGEGLSKQKSHTVHYGTVLDSHGEPLDEALATVFIAPHSFTGQDTVEFSVHGSQYVQREIIASLIKAGATPARAGEFTRRAFTNGKLDLTRAEAVADIIASTSRAANRLAMKQLKGSFVESINSLRQQLVDLVCMLELELDFAEEDVEFADRNSLREGVMAIQHRIETLMKSFATGNAIKNGIPVAIVGATNAGKSSLLNALAQHDRAIVTEIAGTTRDTIEETVEIGDYIFRFIDTAGIRDTNDPIERLGIERSRQAARDAFIIIELIDATRTAITATQPAATVTQEISVDTVTPVIKVYNKCDLLAHIPDDGTPDAIYISAKTGAGIETLKRALAERIDTQLNPTGTHSGIETDDIVITNQRHVAALSNAFTACRSLIEGLDTNRPTDLVAEEARAILDHLAELTGQITTTDILTTIFSRFCIGK